MNNKDQEYMTKPYIRTHASTSTSSNDWTNWTASPIISPTDFHGIKEHFPDEKVREEVKRWMDDGLEQYVKEEAQKILATIEELKKEKKSLKLSILALKTQVEDIKKELREEVENINEVLERQAKRILRYELLDI